MKYSETGKPIRDRSQMNGCQRLGNVGVGVMGSDCLKGMGFSFREMKIFWN